MARAPCAGVSGRVFFGLGRVFWPLGRVFRVGSGFGSKITARARPVDCCGSKNTARAHPPRSSGRVGSGFFRAGWVGLFGSGDPCPGLPDIRFDSSAQLRRSLKSSSNDRTMLANYPMIEPCLQTRSSDLQSVDSCRHVTSLFRSVRAR